MLGQYTRRHGGDGAGQNLHRDIFRTSMRISQGAPWLKRDMTILIRIERMDVMLILRSNGQA